MTLHDPGCLAADAVAEFKEWWGQTHEVQPGWGIVAAGGVAAGSKLTGRDLFGLAEKELPLLRKQLSDPMNAEGQKGGKGSRGSRGRKRKQPEAAEAAEAAQAAQAAGGGQEPGNPQRKRRAAAAGVHLATLAARTNSKLATAAAAPKQKEETWKATGFGAQKMVDGKLQYLVLWESDQPSWEPASLFTAKTYDEWKETLGQLAA